MKVKIVLGSIFAGIVVMSSSNVYAGKVLSADEVKVLFTNKTFDGYNKNNGVSFQVYSGADGTMIHRNPDRTVKTTWGVDEEGQHCANLRWKLCGKIVLVGDGVYHKLDDGEASRIMKNFVEGNQL